MIIYITGPGQGLAGARAGEAGGARAGGGGAPAGPVQDGDQAPGEGARDLQR
jgi:hypothetical protein